MTGARDDRDRGPLDDETPGSQGEIESGSEGDFNGPDPDEEEHADSPALDSATPAGEGVDRISR